MTESDDEDSSTLTQNPATKSPVKEAVETMRETEAEDFIKTAITIQADALKFIDGNPSKTFSKENRNSIREYMIKFMSLVARQQAVLQLIMGKLHEKDELLNDKLISLTATKPERLGPSFAEVLNTQRRRSRSRKREKGKVAIFYPKEELEETNLRRKKKKYRNQLTLQS
ncbi:hypothetical protein AVEN_115692-1 [Araneus ventricosus]|uniref:Uncharacterized protein n=1 Tax=Araneus ventricosus TaxID=182803 RepID=A0A4Y2NDS9_ARAVE|nr:hypothetical protein AVEN_115692-1 [Araneus ventricosus]